MTNCNIDDLISYLQVLLPFTTLDDLKYFRFELKEIEETTEITNIIREDLCSLPFFKLLIEYYGNPYHTIDNFYSDIHDVYDGSLNKEHLKIIITIDKKLLIEYYNKELINTFIFVNIENFINVFTRHLNTDSFSFNNKVNIFFIQFQYENCLNNEYVSLDNLTNIITRDNLDITEFAKNKFATIKDIYDYKEINYYTDLPHFWSINQIVPFHKQCIIKFFSLISNKILDDSKLFLIRGYHNLEFLVDSDFRIPNTSKLIELIDFTLDIDKHYDKLLILRNVLTTYLNNFSTVSQFCNQLESIFNSTKHQFSLYVQNEIKIFIEQKNQVLNETHTLARQISTITNEITNNLRNAIISLLATLIASSIPDVGQKLDNKLILLVLCIVFEIYLLSNLYHLSLSNKQLQGLLKSFKKYLNYISSQSLEGLTYENLTKDFIQVEIDNFNSIVRMSKIIYLTFFIVTFCCILYLIGFC